MNFCTVYERWLFKMMFKYCYAFSDVTVIFLYYSVCVNYTHQIEDFGKGFNYISVYWFKQLNKKFLLLLCTS